MSAMSAPLMLQFGSRHLGLQIFRLMMLQNGVAIPGFFVVQIVNKQPTIILSKLC